MKLYRYMSSVEFRKLMNGETLVNTSYHWGERTSSRGFCFLGEDSVGYSPIEAFDFLSGIVTADYLVEFEVHKQMQRSSGIYANPFGSFGSTIGITEWCTTEYNRHDLEPLRYIKDVERLLFRYTIYDYDEIGTRHWRSLSELPEKGGSEKK